MASTNTIGTIGLVIVMSIMVQITAEVLKNKTTRMCDIYLLYYIATYMFIIFIFFIISILKNMFNLDLWSNFPKIVYLQNCKVSINPWMWILTCHVLSMYISSKTNVYVFGWSHLPLLTIFQISHKQHKLITNFNGYALRFRCSSVDCVYRSNLWRDTELSARALHHFR